MTVTEFENRYFYATELRTFAKTIGVPDATKLRKDELESAIKLFLTTGRIENPAKRDLSIRGEKDVVRGLRLDRPVRVFTNDDETKDFIEREARRAAPGFKRKSGSRYRLNRWREEQLASGVKITYGDLVEEYIRLNQPATRFARVPHGRYINFVADFLKRETGATRARAIAAWHELKTLDIEKTYDSWVRSKAGKR